MPQVLDLRPGHSEFRLLRDALLRGYQTGGQTARAYRSEANKLERWIQARWTPKPGYPDLEQILAPAELDAYLAAEAARPVKPATVNRTRSFLNSLVSIHDKRMRRRRRRGKLRIPSAQHPMLAEIAPVTAIRRAVAEKPIESLVDLRDRALFALRVEHGLSPETLSALDWRDLGTVDGCCFLRDRTLRVDQEGSIAGHFVLEDLEDVLSWYWHLTWPPRQPRDAGPLFFELRGTYKGSFTVPRARRRLSPHSVWRSFARQLEGTTFEGLGTSILRSATLIQRLREGVPPGLLQQTLAMKTERAVLRWWHPQLSRHDPALLIRNPLWRVVVPAELFHESALVVYEMANANQFSTGNLNYGRERTRRIAAEILNVRPQADSALCVCSIPLRADTYLCGNCMAVVMMDDPAITATAPHTISFDAVLIGLADLRLRRKRRRHLMIDLERRGLLGEHIVVSGAYPDHVVIPGGSEDQHKVTHLALEVSALIEAHPEWRVRPMKQSTG